MPVQLRPQTIRWLKSLKLISGEHVLENSSVVLSYNDQMYLENGYLVAQILRTVLRASGSTSQGLLRVRKIAYISSNENWRILKDILEEIGFSEDLDPEQISIEVMRGVVQFLYEKFASKPDKVRKQRINNVDLGTFQTDRPLVQSQNLLQFLLLSFSQSFEISLNECLGLLVEKGRYLRQAIILGTNDRAYEPILKLYQGLIINVNFLNHLLQEEYLGEEKIMDLVGVGVLSQSHEVCQLCCLFLDAVDSDWPEQKGINIIIKSPHHQALDLLMRRLGPKLDSVFNPTLSKRFQSKFLLEMKVYTKLLKYAYSSLYGKEILKALQVSYYVGKGFDLFEPDRKEQSEPQQRTAVRHLLSTACRYFPKKFTQSDFIKLLYCFDVSVTQTNIQKLAVISILGDLLYEIIQKHKQWSTKLYHLIWKYYVNCNLEVKSYILDNFQLFLRKKPQYFPYATFLELHEPVSILQCNQFLILLMISQRKDLPHTLVQNLLKTATIYYYQQLSAGGVLEIISNLMKNYSPLVWSREISQQILSKWPSLQIPPYQPIAESSKKIKYRSVGLKKKEMMQFTELNRYKNMLLVMVQIKDKMFLQNYYKNVVATILKVEKSKVKEMKNTKTWLNNLLALIDVEIMEMREKVGGEKIGEVEEDETIVGGLERADSEDMGSRYDYQQGYGRLEEEEQNQFMKEDIPLPVHPDPNPLLPFSDQEIQNHLLVSQPLFFQNYQLIFLRTLTQKHSPLLTLFTQRYKASASLSHFLSTIHILPYIEKDMNLLQQLNSKLTLSEDKPYKIVVAVIVQAALLSFQFKRSRRVTIKCVQSFYQLLEEKNQGEKKEIECEATHVKTKVEFQWSISGLIRKGNGKISHMVDCFEIVSQLLEKAIGIAEVEPISKIVTEVDANLGTKTPKLQHSVLIPEKDMKQFQQLQKIIDSESKISLSQINQKNSRSTPMKKKKDHFLASPPQDSKDLPERWAEVQKKVIMRRRELESRFQKANP